MACIVRNKEFDTLAKDININPDVLESILYKLTNQEGRESYPTKEEILKEFQNGKSNEWSNEDSFKKAQNYWKEHFSKPVTVATRYELDALKSAIVKTMGELSIVEKQLYAGGWEISVIEPTLVSNTFDLNSNAVLTPEEQTIKAKAVADGTFMKAPNGKDTNLTEKQWLQVRTKAFKDWFGDWENDPTNASKVVDENSEPLVVYHNSRAQFKEFSIDYIDDVDSGFFFSSDSKYAQQYGPIVYPAFLNVRNPINTDEPLIHKSIYSIYAGYKGDITKIDGIIGNDLLEDSLTPSEGWEIMVHHPNQIKSAESNTGEFNAADNNIYREGERSYAYYETGLDRRLQQLETEARRNGKEITVSDILNLVDEDSEFYGITELLKTKKSILDGVSVRVESYNTDGRYNRSRAFYDANTKTIYINSGSEYYGGRADSVILHEVLHAATVSRILGNSELRAEFDDIINKYQEYNYNSRYDRNSFDKNKADAYMEEFIADIWSNRQLIEQLKAIKSTKEATLWDRIKQFFTRIFAGSEGTLMAEASEALDKLLDSPELKQGNRIYREGEVETLEVSTAGDEFGKQFSALNATLKDGRTIEEAYQLDIKGYRELDYTWLQAKRDRGVNAPVKLSNEELYNAYLNLWKQWAEENPTLIEQLRERAKGKILTDKFTPNPQSVSQARALTDILAETAKNNDEEYTDPQMSEAEKNASALTKAYAPKEDINGQPVVRESSQRAIDGSVAFRNSIDRLLNAKGEEGNNLFDYAYLTKTANQVAYGFSAFITSLQEHPDRLLTLFPDKAVVKEDGSIDLDASKEKIQNMTHLELVNFVGLKQLIASFAEDQYSPANNNFDNLDTIDRAQAIYDNFYALLRMGATTFSRIENFGLVFKENEVEAVDKLNQSADDYNTPSDEDSVRETENLQDHWQIESRTKEVVGNMSQIVKQQLARTWKTRTVETVDKDGNSKFEEVPVVDEFGIKEAIDVKETTAQILNWTQGALTLSQMASRLASKVAEHPWLKSIVDKLTDVKNKEYQFQSQFFTSFDLHKQLYSVVEKQNDGTYVSKIVNKDPALQNAFASVVNARRTGDSPLFKAEGGVNQDALSEIQKVMPELKDARNIADYSQVDLDRVATLLNFVSQEFGINTNTELIKNAILNQESFYKMVDALGYMMEAINRQKNNPNYDPYVYSKTNSSSIYGNMREFLKPITAQFEDIAMPTVYDGGKMYQAFVTPSYLTKMMLKFRAPDAEFKQYLQETYGSCEWFRDTSDPSYKASSWKTPWLSMLYTMSQEERQSLFEHKVQLNFNKHTYLKQMSDSEYTLSLLTEYFSEDDRNGRGIAWYGTSMMSNKPSSEFIRFIKFTDNNYRDSILDGIHKVFEQELSRIQTVRLRHKRFATEKKNKDGSTRVTFEESDKQFIKNFDKNGLKFNFLTWLNEDLTTKTELGKLIERKLSGNKESWTIEDESRLYQSIDARNREFIDSRAEQIISEWKNSGLLTSLEKVEKVLNKFDNVEDAARNFIWNNTFAQMNILEMTITDTAFYKNVDDIQKRFAQLHSPGIRANSEVIYDGKRVASETMRTIILKDFDGLKSNIIDNIKEVYDRKIEKAKKEKAKKENPSLVIGLEALRDSVIEDFNNVNLTDAQAYSSPTSYRKKALMFGLWNEDSEKVYQKIKDGSVNISDLKTTFQPLKPFVYTMITSNSGVEGAPIQKMMYGMQNKNSEYLLVMADALLRNEETSRPNLLKVIFEAMEGSFEDGINGIDTIQFDSAVKTGPSGVVDLNSVTTEDEAAAILHDAIYSDNGFNPDYVKEFATEDYSIQQNNPEHFKDHFQAEGSQIRYGIVTDLPTTTSSGEVAKYIVTDGTDSKDYTAEELKEHYEEVESQRIELSINSLLEELGAHYQGEHLYATYSDKDVNAAIYKMLQEEIMNSQRYDSDMLKACQIGEDGKFRLSLGDPVQSKRIEQLLNSIVKKRVNKQEIAGGPLIQVSNFGTSRRLNIVFKEDGGIAYYEALISPYANELFMEFADRNGIIDVEAINEIDPELLKLIGYRIPTEDKYSMAPIKIVGFLPKEAGDGIMLPPEITKITGSDFDVDKFFIMRKELMLAKRYDSKPKSVGSNEALMTEAEAREDYIKRNYTSLVGHLTRTFADSELAKLPIAEKDRIEEEIKERYKKSLDSEIEKIQDRTDEALEAAEKIENEKERERIIRITERSEKRVIRNAEKEFASKIERETKKAQDKAQKEFLRNAIIEVLNEGEGILGKSGMETPFSRAIRKEYLKYMYHTVRPEKGSRAALNNELIDIDYAILTHPEIADKVLRPGGFEPQKLVGYKVAAKKANPLLSWDDLSKMKVGQLKDLFTTNDNIIFVDVLQRLYKYNSAAAITIGMSAVQKTAHAVLSGDGFVLNTESLFGKDEFKIGSVEFGQNNHRMIIDPELNALGDYVGRTLGELVAASADAVKDPVLNLMNINSQTMPILSAFIRVGMPFEEAALLLSSRAMDNVLATYNRESLTKNITLSKVIRNTINEISKRHQWTDEDSKIFYEEVSVDDMVKGLTEIASEDEADKNTVKILNAIERGIQIQTALRSITYLTRLNSISNAVGPLIADNLIMESKTRDIEGFKNIERPSAISESGYEPVIPGNVFDKHPILNSFRKGIDIASFMLKDMPTNRRAFREIFNRVPVDLSTITSNREILSKFSDFYQSYLMLVGDVISTEADKADGIKYFIETFPSDFTRAKAKERYANNALIQAIQKTTEKIGKNGYRTVLTVDTSNLEKTKIEEYKAAWADLHKVNPKLSIMLFKYNFFRGGIGFNPKTFMNLLPVEVKESIPGYKSAFETEAAANYKDQIIDMFVRNNADDNHLVPIQSKAKVEPVSKRFVKVTFDSGSTPSRYFKTSKISRQSSDGMYIYRIVDPTALSKAYNPNSSIMYEKVEVLGNAGEYFEASKDDNYKALMAPPASATQSLVDVTETDWSSAELGEVVNNNDIALKINEQIQKIIVQNYNKMNDRSKNYYYDMLKDKFKKNLEQQGIKLNEESVDEIWNKFCIRPA